MKVSDKAEKQALEEMYREALKDFAKHYVAIWNALKSLGLTDPQVKGAISNILESSGGSMRDIVKEARQRKAWEEFNKLYENN